MAGVNMDFEDEQRAPRNSFPATQDSVAEAGPVRVSIEVERETEGSKFADYRLATGDAGNRVEFSNVIDWKTKEANLKATFPLAAEQSGNLQLGCRHHSAPERRRTTVRGCFTSVDRSY